MKMFVANCTNQVQEFHYSVPGQRSRRTQTIGIGNQIQISGELTSEEVDAIVEQKGPYGMFAASSVAQTHQHIQLLYATGKPVTSNQMRQALERNLALMGNEGVRLRQAAAIAVNNGAVENHPNEFQGMDIEIVEQPAKDGPAPTINEEIIVRQDGKARTSPTPKGGGRSSSRRRAA